MKSGITAVILTRDVADILPRTIKSIKDIVDDIIVCDTGSVDETVDVARKYGVTLVHWEWNFSFSDARNYADRFVDREHTFHIDADEELEPESIPAIREYMKAPNAETVAGLVRNAELEDPWRRTTFYKTGSCVWRGRMHNGLYPKDPGRFAVERFLDNFLITHHSVPNERKRGRPDPIAILRADMNEMPTDQRRMFYLGREHVYKQNYIEAIGVLGQLAQVEGGWSHEVAEAARMTGICYRAIGNEPAAKHYLLRAIEIDATRREPFFDLAHQAYGLGDWEQALVWITAARQLPIRPENYFTQTDVYTWRSEQLLASVLHRMGQGEEARQLIAAVREQYPENEHVEMCYNSIWDDSPEAPTPEP